MSAADIKIYFHDPNLPRVSCWAVGRQLGTAASWKHGPGPGLELQTIHPLSLRRPCLGTSTAEGGELGNNDHFLRRWASLAGEEQRGHRVAATGQEAVDRCAV